MADGTCLYASSWISLLDLQFQVNNGYSQNQVRECIVLGKLA